MWARHNAEWRDTAQVTSLWREAERLDPQLLDYKVKGDFADLVKRLKITLLISREYEHLVMAVSPGAGNRLQVTYLPLPHPSGLAVDRKRQRLFVASTRNPNQILEMRPLSGFLERLDAPSPESEEGILMAWRSLLLPGCLYMHDLALVNGSLHANAVGHNAVVALDFEKGYERVWWPKCIETEDGPVFGQNHIQLNSIAAGDTIKSSYFSASSDVVSSRRPGHRNYPVDGRGVIFSGKTREPVGRGLTRPHSARLFDGRLFVDNSGYGELSVLSGESFETVSRLPGWTRGLCFSQGIAFVGTSRVIPRFKQYAPGLDVDKSVCGIHAIDLRSGTYLGGLIWPCGNQIFAVDYFPLAVASGLPFPVKRRSNNERLLFYAYSLGSPPGQDNVKRLPSGGQSTKKGESVKSTRTGKGRGK